MGKHMKNSIKNGSNEGQFHFRGRERYYAVAGRQLDQKTNDGTDDYINEKSRHERTTLFSIIAVGIVAVVIAGMVGLSLHSFTPLKLNSSSVYTSPVVYDDAGIIEDDEALTGVVEDFCSQTGVIAVVYTVNEEDWKKSYNDLDSYAVQKYADNFHDQMHFVVVCSAPQNETGHYELAMINGVDTNAILTKSLLDQFGKIIRGGLENDSQPGEAFVNAFNYAKSDAYRRMNPDTNTRLINLLLAFSPMLITVIVFVVILVLVVRKFRKDNIALK